MLSRWFWRWIITKINNICDKNMSSGNRIEPTERGKEKCQSFRKAAMDPHPTFIYWWRLPKHQRCFDATDFLLMKFISRCWPDLALFSCARCIMCSVSKYRSNFCWCKKSFLSPQKYFQELGSLNLKRFLLQVAKNTWKMDPLTDLHSTIPQSWCASVLLLMVITNPLNF